MNILQEGLILFPMTYRVDSKNQNYDLFNKKYRIPAWTDRILYNFNIDLWQNKEKT